MHSARALLFILLPAALLFPATLLPAQSTITGSVTNKTTGKAAAGDAVTLIQLAQGMQESTKTTTDAKGNFTLQVPDAGMHLVRITHDKVPYFRPAPPGTKDVQVDVYNGAPSVKGIRGEADVMRVQAQNGSIEVTELWALENESDPPTTQYSAKAFEVWLPKGAELTGGAALGPGGMPVQASPVPQQDPGHYAFVFPIRPGESRFQVSYKLPYGGSMDFAPKLSLPTKNLAVMLPKSMKFQASSGAGAAFQPVNDEINAQVFLAKDVQPGQPLGFAISGTGQMPPDTQGADGAAPGIQAQGGPAAEQNNGAMPANAGNADTRPGGGLGNPVDTPDPLHRYRWWVLGAIAALFAGGVAFAMRKPVQPGETATAPAYPATAVANLSPAATRAPVIESAGAARTAVRNPLLETLKEEMFSLETERLSGNISTERYTELKAALETVLRHALERESPSVPAGV